MKLRKITLLTILVFSLAAFAVGQKASSTYTKLHEDKCKTLEENIDEAGWIKQECPGVGGYKLEVMEGDLRQSINVISPAGETTELNLWHIINGGFSFVGPLAEWRTTGKGKTLKPHAMIVRFTEDAQPDAGKTTQSYLVVIKLTKDAVCVTDLVDPQTKNQNAVARKLADAAATKPCRETEN